MNGPGQLVFVCLGVCITIKTGLWWTASTGDELLTKGSDSFRLMIFIPNKKSIRFLGYTYSEWADIAIIMANRCPVTPSLAISVPLHFPIHWQIFKHDLIAAHDNVNVLGPKHISSS